ncbi:MAG: hypothetical protein GY941_04815 [Planctomycetes bacterium]|nr:hypothetical protein [Planctomycetota bacterium]
MDAIHKAKPGTSHEKMVFMKSKISDLATSVRIDDHWLHAKYPDSVSHDEEKNIFFKAQKSCGAW